MQAKQDAFICEKSMRICHLTSVHSRFDTRIFLKECRSLANAGYQVSLVVADGKGDERRDGVWICDVGTPTSRLNRVRNVTKQVFKKAIEIDASIYHFHDPELIPAGLKLKSFGKRVIFDSHEDVPQQLLGKPYLNWFSRKILSLAMTAYETWSCRQFDAIVAATPFIRDKFLRVNRRTVDINNFPLLGELTTPEREVELRTRVCYVGGITANRGAREIIRAMESVQPEVRLELAGSFSEPALGVEVRQYAGWCRVDELGFLDRDGVRGILGRSFAGLVTLHPIVNYLDALPIKMFEYMSAGIPVIASDFPLWREIIERNDCGVCVDPLNPEGIAKAIDYLFMNTDRAKIMGENGRQAVRERYNWGLEEEKLLSLYATLAISS